MEEEQLPAVLLPNMVGVETEFNASNLEEAITQRASLEGPEDYLLGGSGKPRFGDDWMLKMASVIYSVSMTALISTFIYCFLSDIIANQIRCRESLWSCSCQENEQAANARSRLLQRCHIRHTH